MVGCQSCVVVVVVVVVVAALGAGSIASVTALSVRGRHPSSPSPKASKHNLACRMKQPAGGPRSSAGLCVIPASCLHRGLGKNADTPVVNDGRCGYLVGTRSLSSGVASTHLTRAPGKPSSSPLATLFRGRLDQHCMHVTLVVPKNTWCFPFASMFTEFASQIIVCF